MNVTSATELLVRVADLVIAAGAIGMLAYIVLSGQLRNSRLPNTGRNLVLLGIGLTVGTHVFDVIYTTIVPGTLDLSRGHFVNSAIPGLLHWLLSRLSFALMTVGAFFVILQRRRLAQQAQESERIARTAQDRLLQSEARYRGLVESTSDAVFCYTYEPPIPVAMPLDEQLNALYDGVLAECNQLFAEDLGFDSPAEVIGTTFAEHSDAVGAEEFRKFVQSFVENDYTLTDYDLVYRMTNGRERAFRLTLNGVVANGRLTRLWGSETNTLAWRRTQSALVRRRAFQELLARVSSRFVTTPIEEADALIIASLKEVCDYIAADRGVIAWIDWEAGVVNIDYAYRTVPGSAQSQYKVEDFPYFRERLKQNQVTFLTDTGDPPEGAEEDCAVLAALGIRSYVTVPLAVANEVVGAVSFGNGVEQTFWGSDDVAVDLRFFAELFANYVLRLRSRRELDDAMDGLRRATERLEAENVYLRQEVELSHGFDDIVGESDAVHRCLHLVEKVASTETPVLILGETGTGKELIARALHERSSRRDRPLVKVNCAALPGNLIESELFGYEKGAFTGADFAKAGRFDLADGSTLFLDEIGEIPIELQPKLLRVLQEGEFERLGGTATVKVDVRLIAATNRNLGARVAEGEFRSDLFYRINTFPIELPPLRERGNDIQLLAEHFVKIHAQRLGREVLAISARMMRELRAYAWPGNIRELEGVIQRALIANSGPVLELADSIAPEAASLPAARPDLKSVERDHIVTVLEDTNWKISGDSGAAARLGIPPSTLRSKMKKLAISRPH